MGRTAVFFSFVGMAVQAFLSAYLDKMGMITISSGQQLITGVLFLITALTLLAMWPANNG